MKKNQGHGQRKMGACQKDSEANQKVNKIIPRGKMNHSKH